MTLRRALSALCLVSAAPAMARDMCTERPGLGTPACTVDPGHVIVETGLISWERRHDDGDRVDTLSVAATRTRLGIGETTELQVGWLPLGQERTRMADGAVLRERGAGDIRLAAKQNLANPDGHHLSVAVLPFVTLPVGRQPIGRGIWSGGLIVPVTYDLTDAVQLEFTPEVDAAANEDGSGRHLAYGGVAGAQFDVTDAVEITAEVQALRDRDPGGHMTQWLAALALSWQPTGALQFDIGSAAGLNADAPDARVYGGFATRF